MEAVLNSYDPTTGDHYSAKRFTTVESTVSKPTSGKIYEIPRIGVGIIGMFIQYKTTKQSYVNKKPIPIKEIILSLGNTALSKYNFSDGVEYLKAKYKSDKYIFNYTRGVNSAFLKNLVPVLMGSIIDDSFKNFYPYPVRNNLEYSLSIELTDPQDDIEIKVLTQHVIGNALPIDAIYFPIVKVFDFLSSAGRLLQFTGVFGSINSLMIINKQTGATNKDLNIRIGGVSILSVTSDFASPSNGLYLRDLFISGKIHGSDHVYHVLDNDIDLAGKNVDIELPYVPTVNTSVLTTGHAYFNGKIFADRNYNARRTVDFITYKGDSAFVIKNI